MNDDAETEAATTGRLQGRSWRYELAARHELAQSRLKGEIDSDDDPEEHL